MRDETPSGVLPERVIRQLLKAAAAPGSPWMPPTTRPSGSSRTSKTSPSTSPRSPSLPPLRSPRPPPSARPSPHPFTSRFSSTTTTARHHRALRPGRGLSRPTRLVSLTTTWMQAAMQVRTCPTPHTQTAMAAAATSSVLNRLRRPQALPQRYPALASMSSENPWEPTTSLPSYTSKFNSPSALPPARPDKLFRMINDPKSQHFISWTELGASFVVSNVGEFSRSILGSHFKHNNVSLSEVHA